MAIPVEARGGEPPYPPVLRRATEWAMDRTVALYFQMPDGRPVPWGTGVLLRIADASFVLTASHVLERIREATLRIGACVEGARFVTVSSFEMRRTEDLKHLDVGIVRLDERDAQRISAHKKFLRVADLDLAPEMPTGAYLVTGFPAQLTKIDDGEITANRFSYLTYLAAIEDAVPNVTLGLEFRESWLRHEDGSDARMPELKAISGCGIWRVCTDEQASSIGRWDPSWIRLCGIEHAVTPRRSIRGTIVGHVLKIIAGSYPELVPSIRLSTD